MPTKAFVFMDNSSIAASNTCTTAAFQPETLRALPAKT
jgi:hypothetical protein